MKKERLLERGFLQLLEYDADFHFVEISGLLQNRYNVLGCCELRHMENGAERGDHVHFFEKVLYGRRANH